MSTRTPRKPTAHAAAGAESRPGSPSKWDLRLYVAGQTPNSLSAISNLAKLCERHIKGSYHIDVIDLLTHPSQCRDDEIVAIPTLVRRRPLPIRKIVGDLSNAASTVAGLQLPPAAPLRTPRS